MSNKVKDIGIKNQHITFLMYNQYKTFCTE